MSSEPALETDPFRDYKIALKTGAFEGQFDDWMKLTQDTREQLSTPLRPGAIQFTDAKTLTTERKSTHGDWLVQSKLFMRLMAVFEKSPNWSTLEAHQKAALINIAQKQSRILSGDASEPDHWDDIGGYALLGKGGHAA